jgi:hypothetical protein
MFELINPDEFNIYGRLSAKQYVFLFIDGNIDHTRRFSQYSANTFGDRRPRIQPVAQMHPGEPRIQSLAQIPWGTEDSASNANTLGDRGQRMLLTLPAW